MQKLNVNIRRFLIVSGAVLSILPLLLSCGKPKVEDEGKELPLIATSDELTAASDSAGDRMVVLDLYADWCMPCKLVAPVLYDLANENKNSVFFYRVNVDKSPDIAQSFGVRGIPYVIFMKHKKAVYALTGVKPKEQYQKVLDICKGTGSPDECVSQLNERM